MVRRGLSPPAPPSSSAAFAPGVAALLLDAEHQGPAALAEERHERGRFGAAGRHGGLRGARCGSCVCGILVVHGSLLGPDPDGSWPASSCEGFPRRIPSTTAAGA